MNADEFRIKGKEMVDYIADYLENINELRVTPDVEPGYLRDILPKDAPFHGENWDDIFKDFESKILPGITHWQHSKFHAYFPAGNSYPSIMGEMLSSGLGIVGFSWAASPSCTELETIVLDWLGRMINLPRTLLPFVEKEKETQNHLNGQSFANNGGGGSLSSSRDYSEDEDIPIEFLGGGVILGSASECVLVSLLSARTNMLGLLKAKHPFVEDGVLLSKLVMYTSKLAHSCVEKAGMIAMVKIRLVETDENFSMRGSILEKIIKEDKSNGLIPFFVSCTFGTTSCCSFDNIQEIGVICNREELYLHVDGAYAGSALICEEFRHYINGLELVKNKYMLTKALSVDPIYLRYKEMDKAIDYRHWGIALSRRFRALKMWFTLRSYGIDGLQKYIREHVRLAKKFEQYVLSDSRFEILGQVTMGLVCFRLKGPNQLSQNLLFTLNDSGKIHMVPAVLDEKYVIRYCVNAQHSNDNDILSGWELIKSHADEIIKQYEFEKPGQLPGNSLSIRRTLQTSTSIEEEASTPTTELSSKLKRLRFGVSKMVSEPRISINQKKYNNRRAFSSYRFGGSGDSGKSVKSQLARRCSIIEKLEDDDDEFLYNE